MKKNKKNKSNKKQKNKNIQITKWEISIIQKKKNKIKKMKIQFFYIKKNISKNKTKPKFKMSKM